MNSDSIRSAAISMASSNPKDFPKKKKGNRSAKLKQCKLDARREQWLSQVKNKDVGKNETNGGWGTRRGRPMHLEKERGHLMDKLEINSRADEESYGDGSSMRHCSDTESSPSNSPTSHISVSESNHSGTTFTACSRSCSRTSSSRSSSISSNGCGWGIMSEDDDGDVVDDGCLDDWEAVADALAVIDKMKLEHSPDSALVLSPLDKQENSEQSSSQLGTIQGICSSNVNQESGEAAQRPPENCWGLKARIQCHYNDASVDTDNIKLEDSPESALVSPPLDIHGNPVKSRSQLETGQGIDGPNVNPENGETAPRPPSNYRAWRADDAFRPGCLPNLSKQYSLPSNPERRFGCELSVWGCKNLQPVPTSCPICCEDLDCTDSSFIPCLCGFRLCLFCHKRILEEDGRCPGCRKRYDHDPVKGEAAFDGGRLTFRLARSCGMITRS